jgi:hypothetical protein
MYDVPTSEPPGAAVTGEEAIDPPAKSPPKLLVSEYAMFGEGWNGTG